MTISFNKMESTGIFSVRCDCKKEQYWGNFHYYSQNIQICANQLPCPCCSPNMKFTVGGYVDGKHIFFKFLNFKAMEFNHPDKYFWVLEEELIKNKRYIKKDKNTNTWTLYKYNPLTRIMDGYRYPNYQEARMDLLEAIY